MSKPAVTEVFWLVLVPVVLIAFLSYEIIRAINGDIEIWLGVAVGGAAGFGFISLAFQWGRRSRRPSSTNAMSGFALMLAFIAAVPFLGDLSPAVQAGVLSFLDAGAMAFLVIVLRRLIAIRRGTP